MDLGMIVNPDHMSQRGVDDLLTLAESRGYSGVISPCRWMDPRNWPRIFQLGGMAFPAAGSAQGFVDAWRAYRPKATPQFFGWGYGADLGGLATRGRRRRRIPNQVLTRSSRWTAQRRSTASARASAYSTTRPRASRTTGCTRSGTRGCEERRSADRRGHVARPRGLPPDVGARRRHTRQRVQERPHQLRQARPGRPAPHRFPASSWRRRASRCGGHGPGAGAPWSNAGSVALRPR